MAPVPFNVCASDLPSVNETALTTKVVFAPTMIWDELAIEPPEPMARVPSLFRGSRAVPTLVVPAKMKASLKLSAGAVPPQLPVSDQLGLAGELAPSQVNVSAWAFPLRFKLKARAATVMRRLRRGFMGFGRVWGLRMGLATGTNCPGLSKPCGFAGFRLSLERGIFRVADGWVFRVG